MKNRIGLLLVIIGFTFQSALLGQQLKFKINNQKDTTVFLIKYVGSQLFYADTAEIKKGVVIFDGKNQEQGIMGVLLPGQKFFEFLNCGEEVFIETSVPNFIPSMKVHKSEENMVFLEYINFMSKNSELAKSLTSKRDALPESDKEGRSAIDKEISAMGVNVKEVQKRLASENSDNFVGKLIRMSSDVDIPIAPRNPDGSYVDSAFGYKYLRDHYFDNVDFSDDRLVNTPVIQKKLEYFYSQQMLLPHPDTLIKYLTRVVDQIPTGTMMYRFFVTKITANFERSKIMGMDKVVNSFVYRYYCPKDEAGNYKAFWMDSDKLEELCADAKKRLRLMHGEIPPNVMLPDSTNQNWLDFYSLKSDYIILYFWDPGCGHCKKETPKLQKLYDQKLKARNVEIFAVGKATGADFEDWKKFIKKNNLSFINVGLTHEVYNQAKKDPLSLIPSKTTLESLNYQDTYDIFSTPRVWILDKDKRIVGKGLGVAQIEEYLDRLQGFEHVEKIFSVEEEKANKDQ